MRATHDPQDSELILYDDQDNDGTVDDGETVATMRVDHDVAPDGTDCSGTDTVYVDKLGAAITVQGKTREIVVEDECVDPRAAIEALLNGRKPRIV